MRSTLKRVLAVSVGALGTLVPVAGANAAPAPVAGPAVGQVAAVIGPTVLTTAPSNFSNTNIPVSAGSNLTGGQAGL